MNDNDLELVWIPEDMHWVVLTPSGHILGKRFTTRDAADKFFEDVQSAWDGIDFSEPDFDVDFDNL